MKKFLLLLIMAAQPALGQGDYVGSGRAIRFDGVDDYIDLGNIYDDLTLPLTISAWVYVEASPEVTQYPIFSSQDNSPTYHGFTFVCSTLPHIGFTIGDGKGGNNPAFRRSRAGYFKTLGRWVYMTSVARSGTDLQTYLNGYDVGGEYQGSSVYPMYSDAPNEVAKIGHLFSNNLKFWFKGVMDEVRIWNRALTLDEIRESMCRRLKREEPGLIGYWNFDEIGGDDVLDSSPNQFHGKMKGNPTRVFSGAPVGDKSARLYTTNWTGKTLSHEGVTLTRVGGNPYGVHIYSVENIPSQTVGLDVASVQLPYHGVYLADDSNTNSFDFEVANVCATYRRPDNAKAEWNFSTQFTGIMARTEIVRGYQQANLDVDLGEDRTLCDEESLTLIAHEVQEGKSFLWNTGETTPAIEVKSSGKYAVRVVQDCLSGIDSVTILFKNVPGEFSLGNDDSTCPFEPRTLSAGLEKDDAFTFVWQDGSGEATHLARTPGTYWLRIENECGSAVDSIVFSQKTGIVGPQYNFISPDNGDELNQFFIVDDALLGARLSVFNRWGKNVYTSSRYNNQWDGNDLPPGVYFYTIISECMDPVKGTVTIMR